MDPLIPEIAALSKLSHRRIFHVLQSDSPRHYELTKCLANILYNICTVQSIEVSATQKKLLEQHIHIVQDLLSRKVSLASKKSLFELHIPLVVLLASTCHQLLD